MLKFWKRLHPIIQLYSAAIGLFCISVGLTYVYFFIHTPPLPERLVTTIHEVVKNDAVFDKTKLIQSQEDYDFKGDGTMSGTFQLPDQEVQQLFNTDQALHCPKGKACKLSVRRYNGLVFYYADVPGGASYELYVKVNPNDVEWSVGYY